jgi:uncharacterized protein (TIGR03435 family)
MKISILCASTLCAAAALAQQTSPKIAFEVVSIKAPEPQPMNQIRMSRNSDPGRVRFGYFSLKDYIRVAYRVKDFQVEGPEWMDTARFDVEGKFPEGGTEAQVPEMLQSMLADRFKLTIHRETKDHAIYALVPAKGGPRLKKAEAPAAPAPGAAGPRSGGMTVQVDEAGAHLKAASATLSMIAEMLSRFSELPVVDMTGIEGNYEFDLVMSPETMRGMRAMGAGGHGPDEGGASPEGAGTIHEAVQKYGLKLERRKAPMEMIVVDHVEKLPTEN